MFGALTQEKHSRQVTSDQNRLMCEAASDVIIDDETNEEIDISDLDAVMDNDGDIVSDADVEALEALIGSLTDDTQRDVTSMTREEISQSVAGIVTPTIDQLDQ